MQRDTEEMYNHRTRKYYTKQALRDEKIPLMKWTRNLSGELIEVLDKEVSRWRVVKHEENNNVFKWHDRVKKSVEYGKRLQRINADNAYNRMVAEAEERSAKKLEFYKEHFGEELGKQKHNDDLERDAKRAAKKYQL